MANYIIIFVFVAQLLFPILKGNDSVATLQNQYRNVLVQQEERHAEEKRSLIESHLLKLSALEAQLAETQIRNEDLVQLQTVNNLPVGC